MVAVEKRVERAYEAAVARRALSASAANDWPEVYTNADTGKEYKPHHDDEERFVYSDAPRYALAKGGEGGGKSVAGIVKTLNRLKRGMDGIMGSPDLPHFKRSLWPEFKRWCPWNQVIESQQRRGRAEWEPDKPFTLTFKNGAKLFCGGFEDPGAWEGPNVSFAHFDEARRHKTPAMLKVLDGRVRITGPQCEPPQLYFTTTPAKHWLFDYFGPGKEDEQDPLEAFKADSLVISLLTVDNEAAGNLSEGFTRQRGQSLSESEKRVLLEAAWEDIEDVDHFLPSIELWNVCREDLPALDAHTPCVLALDAGESNDTFATVIVSRHPASTERVAVRYARAYVPKGEPLDFDAIEQDIRGLCARYAVQELTYDPMLLGQTIRRLKENPVTVYTPFPQGGQRLEADKGLLDLIMQRRIAHDGNLDLKNHIANSDRKVDGEGRKLRIVKRSYALKIDLAVALSMGAYRLLNLEAPGFAVMFSGKAKTKLA
jgi:hypothetical protein